MQLTHCPQGDVTVILNVQCPNTGYGLSLWTHSGQCHRTLLMISQHWFRLWLGAWWHQAITWANVDPDLCHHIASLGHKALKTHKTYWIICLIFDKRNMINGIGLFPISILVTQDENCHLTSKQISQINFYWQILCSLTSLSENVKMSCLSS